MSQEIYKKAKKKAAWLFFGVIVVIAIATAWFALTLSSVTNNSVTNNTRTQQRYCDQLGNLLNIIYENGGNDEDAVAYILDNVEASGSSWAFLIGGQEVIFARNEMTTSELEELKDQSEFMANITSDQNIITTSTFTVEGEMYRVGIITDREYFIIHDGIREYRMYLILAFVIVTWVGVGTITGIQNSRLRQIRRLQRTSNELRQRNEEFEKISEEAPVISTVEPITLEPNEELPEKIRYKQYKFKFYLNARHAIYIDGLMGELHPHTWEIVINVVKKQNDFIEFNKLERKIEAFISAYQDKELNSITPFDVINPTLENCCDFFKTELSRILENEGWRLVMMEMSETPSRSYVISMVDENDLNR